jgi:hypothetical protein
MVSNYCLPPNMKEGKKNNTKSQSNLCDTISTPESLSFSLTLSSEELDWTRRPVPKQFKASAGQTDFSQSGRRLSGSPDECQPPSSTKNTQSRQKKRGYTIFANFTSPPARHVTLHLHHVMC